ncbi:hypothetical protein C5B42_02740 [Candidatus Cerribacteria bacterium 'Amazon FNV 2010 28 9']|uniref:Membrane insertase YidC/Oxa/ALB C-terminal domain-containing protein n=1 Tax=Candidatus Cerribacteria bacterium 'Amazon FNV 2010 28 9' TaxID=2081795 RepID=A0A317JTX5_9BACT|nr:MAG: hypothetical protein C5B42_02740 [Candidatus Cerribacteria bacterium 'Amazon FNV 2010 28 9']
MQQLAQTLLIVPIYQFLKFLTLETGSFGFAIILLTLIMRAILLPLSLPTMNSQKKLRALKPELDKLKEQFKGDRQKLQLAQMELYKKHNINLFSGCLPQILQIIVLIALYNVLRTFVTMAAKDGITVQTLFYGLDLAKPDTTHIIPLVAAVSQLVLSIMILPGKEKHDLVPNNAKSKKVKEENKKETNEQEMAEAMQQQMVFMMPLMTALFAWSFPAGLGVYWIVTTLFTLVSQYVLVGPGGLVDVKDQVLAFMKKSQQNVK